MTLTKFFLFYATLFLSLLAQAEVKIHQFSETIKVSCGVNYCNSPYDKEVLGKRAIEQKLKLIEAREDVIKYINSCSGEVNISNNYSRCDDHLQIVNVKAGYVSDPFFVCQATLDVSCNL